MIFPISKKLMVLMFRRDKSSIKLENFHIFYPFIHLLIYHLFTASPKSI